MHVSYDEAVKYAKGDASDARKLGGTAYIGQIIVVEGLNEKGKNGVWTYQLVPSTQEGYFAELQPIGGGNGSLAVETLVLAEHATEIGQIIYVTVGNDDYPAGPYIVTSVGNVSRIGTTTADGDLSGAISTLESYVGKPAVVDSENPENNKAASGLFASVAALEAKDTETSNSITSLDEKYEGEVKRIDGNITTANNEITAIKNNWKVKDIISGENSLVDADGKVDLTSYATQTYVTEAVNAIKVPEYEIKKLNNNDLASQYALYKDGTQVGPTIDILKDMFVSGAQMVTDPEGQEPGRYIELTIANNDGTKIYINVTELINNYNGSTYITVDGSGIISLNYDTVKSQLTTDFANVFDAYGSASNVNTALNNYKTEVSGKFANYFTKEEVGTEITNAVTPVDEKFANYFTKEEVNTTFANYFTKEEVNTTFATKTEVKNVSDALDTYKNDVTEAFKAYSTTTEVEGKISTALESYYTKTEVNNAIATASNEINKNFEDYFTKTEVGTEITTALGSYYTKDAADGKFLDKTSVIETTIIDAIVNGTYQEAQ
jgi:hypothetical protein